MHLIKALCFSQEVARVKVQVSEICRIGSQEGIKVPHGCFHVLQACCTDACSDLQQETLCTSNVQCVHTSCSEAVWADSLRWQDIKCI